MFPSYASSASLTHLDPVLPNLHNGATICRSTSIIAHPEYASPLNPGGTGLPHEVWVSMEVDTKEEMGLGIPSTSIPAAFEDIAGLDEGLDRANTAAGQKRKTKPSVSGPAQRLTAEKGPVCKAVASLNTVRWKGQKNISLVEVLEDDDVAE
ncbi:hypothetical protein B0H14DRAFT_2559183 [Mycena olivaceomarginata]|nr:hypothetical protein B0H14DRAFT_2559183 [Mycena olivaceomarginata]